MNNFSCQGDSGSPFIKYVNDRAVLMGITQGGDLSDGVIEKEDEDLLSEFQIRLNGLTLL